MCKLQEHCNHTQRAQKEGNLDFHQTSVTYHQVTSNILLLSNTFINRAIWINAFLLFLLGIIHWNWPFSQVSHGKLFIHRITLGLTEPHNINKHKKYIQPRWMKINQKLMDACSLIMYCKLQLLIAHTKSQPKQDQKHRAYSFLILKINHILFFPINCIEWI